MNEPWKLRQIFLFSLIQQQLDELEAIRAEFVPRNSQNGDQLASDEEEDYDQIDPVLLPNS